MLETKNLKKTYRTKKGVHVEVLKGISLKFPQKGMVFLLGKSGSGKSTMLNLLGGLDSYDQGEIIIKGVSSKDFSQNEFDSYRNTYVGFIFQEYNVLEEFSVGMNIALAIELQGRKAADSEINQILKEVDLEGYGERKPNELSGGQKQRVAIARALVKNPQIIMADEPTGALDSNTGKQVLETLKRLSADKLVIVVSHDREFAEQYGDRIIELADGKVIRDVEQISGRDGNTAEKEGMAFLPDEIVLTAGYHLTEQDRVLINEYLQGRKENVKMIVQNSHQGTFEPTNQTDITYDTQDFKLIRSKLPLKNAFKMGTSALKHKKIRLVMTILLSFIAFSLFALADTFGSYDNVKTCTRSLVDSKINYASLSKSMLVKDEYSSFSCQLYFQDKDLKEVSKKTGLNFAGVYPCGASIKNYDTSVSLTENADEMATSYATYYSGFMAMSNERLKEFGYEVVAGKLPEGNKKQAAITTYLFETFKKAGYRAPKSKKVEQISAYEDIVGKTIRVDQTLYEITGVVDVHMDFSRYEIINENLDNASAAEMIAAYALEEEIIQIQECSTAGVLMVSPQLLESLMKEQIERMNTGVNSVELLSGNDDEIDFFAGSITEFSNLDLNDVNWLDERQTTLNKNEVLVPLSYIQEDFDNMSKEKALQLMKDNAQIDCRITNDMNSETETIKVRIAGIIDDTRMSTENAGVFAFSDNLIKPEWKEMKGSYAYVTAPMPKEKSKIQEIVKFNQEKIQTKYPGTIRYQLCNSVIFELDAIDEILKSLSKVFLYIGIGFALFAALMFANFIATSISYKKQEIGILRAIGARSNDVFRIFFTESFVIAAINFSLACAATAVATNLMNKFIRTSAGILITVLDFGARQILLLLFVSILTAWIASFIPVYRIARKKPIDAIRNK